MPIHPRVLLVEGADELRVLPHLLENGGVAWGARGQEVVRLNESRGLEALLAPGTIEAELKASGVRAVGILVDADEDAQARWQRLRTRLLPLLGEARLPPELPPEGFIHPGPPRLGVWVMPDNVTSGMLETLMLRLKKNTTPELDAHVAEACTTASQLGAPYKALHRHKAELATWLAWQDPPGLQKHDAIKHHKLAIPEDHGLVTWFRALFEL